MRLVGILVVLAAVFLLATFAYLSLVCWVGGGYMTWLGCWGGRF